MRHSAVGPLSILALSLAFLSLATFLEGKRLWAAYNAIGSVATLAFLVVTIKLDLQLPRGATLVLYATAMLHYVGGSLGGHYGITGINGLYAVFPWWDRMTHFFGATGVAMFGYHVLKLRGWNVPSSGLAFFAFVLAIAVGVGVELFEFAGWTFFGTIDQGFYSNTMMDLYDDTTGALFGAALAHAISVAKTRKATMTAILNGIS